MRRVLQFSVLLAALAAPASADVEAGMLAYANGDFETALRELTPAAEAGNTLAQFTLAFMYSDGRGVTQDEAMAVTWYGRAAELGHMDAQYALGYMLANGRGVSEPDPTGAARC